MSKGVREDLYMEQQRGGVVCWFVLQSSWQAGEGVAHPEEASARQSMAEYSASGSVTSSSKVAVEGSSIRTDPS